jgi:hypothetical protein
MGKITPFLFHLFCLIFQKSSKMREATDTCDILLPCFSIVMKRVGCVGCRLYVRLTTDTDRHKETFLNPDRTRPDDTRAVFENERRYIQIMNFFVCTRTYENHDTRDIIYGIDHDERSNVRTFDQKRIEETVRKKEA